MHRCAVVLAALCACGEPPDRPVATPPATPPASGCAPIDGIESVVEAEQMVVFGEIHGTVEGPRAFGEAVCHVVARHGHAVVALEIGPEEQKRIDDYLTGTGSGLERTVLLGGAHWVADLQDGRRSIAMFDLLERLRGLRADGAQIEVIAFDARAEPASKNLEQQLADSLATARASHPGSPFLVLVGNVHPSTREGAPWDPKFSPMGRRLLERGVELLPILLRFSGGSAWNCDAGTPVTCGAHELEKAAMTGKHPRVELFAAPDETGYRGALWVGTATASPPALAAVTDEP